MIVDSESEPSEPSKASDESTPSERAEQRRAALELFRRSTEMEREREIARDRDALVKTGRFGLALDKRVGLVGVGMIRAFLIGTCPLLGVGLCGDPNCSCVTFTCVAS